MHIDKNLKCNAPLAAGSTAHVGSPRFAVLTRGATAIFDNRDAAVAGPEEIRRKFVNRLESGSRENGFAAITVDYL